MFPALRQYFVYFFDCVNAYVSSNVRPEGLGFKEPACTENLLMCLSANQPPEYLPYTAAALRQDVTAALAEMNLEEKFSFNCTARGFNQNHEGVITQSDYAIRLRVRDNSRHQRHETTTSVFFFQAKVRNTSGFDRDHKQERKIKTLRRFIGQNHLSYSLYNPLTDGGILLAYDPWAVAGNMTKWSDFMADWISGSVEDDADVGDHGAWLRNALIDGRNTEANEFIAKQLETENRDWTLYKPAVIDIGIELPIYSLGNRPTFRGPHNGGGGMFGSTNDDES